MTNTLKTFAVALAITLSQIATAQDWLKRDYAECVSTFQSKSWYKEAHKGAVEEICNGPFLTSLQVMSNNEKLNAYIVHKRCFLEGYLLDESTEDLVESFWPRVNLSKYSDSRKSSVVTVALMHKHFYCWNVTMKVATGS